MRSFSLVALMLATACGGAATQESGDAQDVTVPPIALVSAGVYRGPRPTQATLQQLKALGVQTVLDLEDTQSVVTAEGKAVSALGMKFVSKPMSGFWTPDDNEVNQIESIVADTAQRPIFIHCEHGQDRTGLIVGLFRVEDEGWTPKAAYKEMLSYGFHQILVFLNHYYEEKTGFED